MTCYYPLDTLHRKSINVCWVAITFDSHQIDLCHIPLNVSYTTFLYYSFVKGSAKFFSKPHNVHSDQPTSHELFHNIASQSDMTAFPIVNFVFGFCDHCLWITCKEIEGTGFYQSGMSDNKLQSHLTSEHASSKVINSDSMGDLALWDCLDDFQDTS